MEVLLRRGNIEEGRALADLLGGDVHATEADRAFRTYCMTMHMRPPVGYGNFQCVEERVSLFERGAPARPNIVVTDVDVPQVEEMPVQRQRPMLSGALNILVISSVDAQDASGGIFYYMRQRDIRHRIQIAREYREGDWDYIIDLDSEELIAGNFSVDFRPAVSPQLAYLGASARLATCGSVLIGIGAGKDSAVAELRQQLTDRRIRVVTNRLTDIGQQSPMRRHLREWENSRFCVIGVGSENEINVFIPTVRSFIIAPRRQTVYVIMPVDTGRNYTRGFERYYRNTYIYPSVELTLSEDMRIFTEGYEDFSGRRPTYETILGYDMMHYIHTHTQEGARDRSDYLTNIVRFEYDMAVRNPIAFRMDNRGNVEQLILDMGSMDEPEEELTGIGSE
jgi:hypothetical protein